MTLIEAAKVIAKDWHSSQKRKYTGEPYTVHTDEVAALYAEFFPADEVGIAAAHLHDVFEDTLLTPAELRVIMVNLGISTEKIEQVISLVLELTDVFTKVRHGQKNRQERKALEAERLSATSVQAQNIKVADLISNTKNIVAHDKKFAKTYIQEKRNIIFKLQKADMRLVHVAFEQLMNAQF